MNNLLTSQLSYEQIISSYSILYNEDRFWRMLIHRRFPSYLVPNDVSPRELYKNLESFTTRQIYLTVTISRTKDIKPNKERYFSYGKNLAFLTKNLPYFSISLPYVFMYDKVKARPGERFRVIYYYPLVSERKYYTKEEFYHFYSLLSKCMVSIPSPARVRLYGPEVYYSIED